MIKRPTGTRLMQLFIFPVFLLIVEVAVTPETITKDSVDDQKIFYGTSSSFERPASVDYVVIVTATKEHKKALTLDSRTAQYWILINKANENAIHTINIIGNETDYDLIALKGYLESLDLSTEVKDITELVLEKLGE